MNINKLKQNLYGNTAVLSKLNKFDSEEEQRVPGNPATLGYFVRTSARHCYTVPIDEEFSQPSYYRNVVNMLMDATEDDIVVFMINSPGGSKDALDSLLEAIRMTEAETLAVIAGGAHSAASILALNCDSIVVTESSAMLCHYVRYGTAGKGSDVLAHVEHVSKTSQKLVRDTYRDFLSDPEIEELISGREIYLDADEIAERLSQRDEIRAAREAEAQAEAVQAEQAQQAQLQMEQDLEPKPKRKSARKAA